RGGVRPARAGRGTRGQAQKRADGHAQALLPAPLREVRRPGGLMASWAPALRDRPGTRHAERARPRRRRAVLLGGHVVSDGDAALLAQRLGEVVHHLADRCELAESEGTRGLREATRVRVAEDLELVSAALERSQRSAR